MKYVLRTQRGDTPTPDNAEKWAQLSEEEQRAVYADYQAINDTPGVTPSAGDADAALALVDGLELDRYHYLHATRAELVRRLDRVEEARAACARALELVHADPERRFLEQRLAEL